jgi:hypothetical protein
MTLLGTVMPRARLRSRITFAPGSTTTAWTGTPRPSASARQRARRLGSRPVVSTTVVSLRLQRFSTMSSNSSNASADARWSRSPAPTTGRSRSDEMTWSGPGHHV